MNTKDQSCPRSSLYLFGTHWSDQMVVDLLLDLVSLLPHKNFFLLTFSRNHHHHSNKTTIFFICSWFVRISFSLCVFFSTLIEWNVRSARISDELPFYSRANFLCSKTDDNKLKDKICTKKLNWSRWTTSTKKCLLFK